MIEIGCDRFCWSYHAQERYTEEQPTVTCLFVAVFDVFTAT